LTGGKESARKLPTRDECIALLEESGCSEGVVRHCIAVSDLAVRIAKRCGADVDLVEAGSLLHDLGRCKSHGLDHAVIGVELAKSRKLPESVVRIIERHIGGGITKAEAKKLGLPEKDYIPKTLEEKVVSHADKLIANSRRVTVKEAVGRFVRDGLTDSALRILKNHEELSALCRMNIDDI
jgi:uncharacterized protein (TIGR00295 family)